MTSKIILDTKNANSNQPTTNLGTRFIGNRDAYRQGTLCFEQGQVEYLLISTNNSKISWSLNPVRNYSITATGNMDGNYYEYKIQTYDAIKAPVDVSTKFLKPNFFYSLANNLTKADFYLEEPLFHWTRNDTSKQRFEWDGQNWKLLKGGSPVSLGILTPDTSEYTLPKGIIDEDNVFVNLIYVGQDLTQTETKKFSVKPDPFTFDGTFDAALFVDQNKVQFKDTFIQANAGKEIWFFNESLDMSDGIIHPTYNAYYLSPKPQGFETPLLRLGNREYLSVQYYDDESLFPLSLEKGIAYISKQTGKVSLLNPNDYTLYYDGLVLSSKPISFVDPVLIENGKVYPKTNFTAGFDVIADGSGILPTGDNPTSSRPDGSGLKIAILNKYNYVANDVGDMIDVNVYPTHEDVPNELKWSKSYLTLVKNTLDFTIHIAFKSTFLSFQQDRDIPRELYFVQSAVPLKSYTKYNDEDDFRIYSAKQDKYTITGGILRLIVNGITRNLNFYGFSGVKQAWEIQDHFDTLLGSSNNPIKSENRYLVIKASSSIQILNTSDLEILQSLGFVAQNISNWYLTTGLYFDLQKRNTPNADYDFTSTILYNDIQVSKEIIQSTYAFLDFTPREDYDGYDANTFFKVGKNTLTADVEIQHLFNENKFAWIRNITRTRRIDTPTSILDLEPGVVDQSTSITLTKDKYTASLVENETFDTNIAGFARYFTRYSKQIEQGYNATINDNIYTLDNTHDINPNDWIQTNSNFFKVNEVDNNTLTLSSMPSDTTWKAYKGYSEPDPTLLTAECFISLNNVRSFLKVKKVHATGTSTLKQIITAKCSSEVNLIARYDDNTEQPIAILKDVALGLSTDQCFVDITDPRVLDLEFKIRVGSDTNLYQPAFDNPSSDVSINSITGEITLSNTLSSITGDVVFIPLAYQNLEVLTSSETTSEFYDVKPTYIIEEVSLDDYVVETSGGNISFLSSLDAGVGVEVEYYTDENTQIVEPILFTIQNETTTKITSSKYSFNPNAYTIEQTVNPQVYVGAEIVGIFDASQTSSFDYTTNILTLPSENTEDFDVKISYSIKQAVGGEYTIKVVNPIWLPLMQIPKGSTRFEIYGDYTNSIKTNSVIKTATEFFVVDSSTFSNGKTNVIFDSPAKFDSGARSPSDDPKIFFLSNENIFIPLSSLTGNINHVIYAKPLSSTLTISEDITAYIQVNTLMFLDADCYQVKSVRLSEDQTRTVITFTSVLSIDISSEPVITVSARPVYNQNDTKIYGKSFLSDQDYKLIKYDMEYGIGSELVVNYDYSINDATGEIQLNLNHSVQPDISYYFFHTRPQSLSPFLSNGRLIYPTYKANFNQYIESPYTGKRLFAKCVINAQDQFYLRVVEQDEYEAEINFNSPQTNGRSKSFGDTPKGVGLGIYDDLAKDVIARKNLSYYNQVITNFENLDLDRSVGDQDGPFKFEIIQASSDYFGPGIEDPLTRQLNPRYVALEILNSDNPDTYILPSDPIKIGATYNDVTGGLTGGSTPNSSQIDTLINKQKDMIYNDVDDIILTDTKTVSTYYFLGVNSTLYFIWKAMCKDSVFSRLYPEKMQSAYFLGDGDFNFLDTYGKRIGSVSNPLINPITNISSVTLRKRGGAYFVYDYSKTGYAGVSNDPTFILSAVPLSEFPIDPDTGLPNTDELIHSNNSSGSTYSVQSGNPDLVIPPLSKGNLLAISNENNTFTSIKDRNAPVVSLSSFDYRNATVSDIIEGCYVVLNTSNPIVDNISLDAQFGQTIIQNLSGGDIDNQTPTLFEYRIGFDVKVNYKTGSIIDNSYPSLYDPNFPVKEFVEQNPPHPNECLEGDVFFNYTDTEPFEDLPALNGLDKNDSGLMTIPYNNINGKERELLNRLTRDIKAILNKTYLSNPVYPDEIRFDLNIDTSTGILTSNIDPTDKNDLVIIKEKGFFQSSSDSELIIPRMNIYSNNNNVQYKISNFITGNEFIVYSYTIISVFPTPVYQYRLKFVPSSSNYDFTSLFNTEQTPIIFKFIQSQTFTDTCIQFTYSTGASQWSVTTSISSPTSYNITNLDLSTINEIKFQTVGILSSIYGLIPDIPFNTMIPFTCSLNAFHDDNNFSINEDRCSVSHQYLDFSYFAPHESTIDSVNVQTELSISNTYISYYNLISSSTTTIPNPSNSSTTANDGEPYTFQSSISTHTLKIPSFFGKGNTTLPYNNIKGNVFTSAKVDTSSNLPTNYTAFFHNSSDTNYQTTLFNITTPTINNVLPNDLVFFEGISLIGIVQETALNPTITINLNPSFPKFSSATNTQIQMTDDFDTSTFTNNIIFFQIDSDQTIYKCSYSSYDPTTKILSISNLESYDYNTNTTTPAPIPTTLTSGYVTGQSIVPFDNFTSSFPFNDNATVTNHSLTFNENTISNNNITFTTSVTQPFTLFLRSYVTTATLTYSISTPAIKLNENAPSLLNSNLATINTTTNTYLNNINTYLFPHTIPDNHTLPVTFSIRRARRFDKKFSSFQADYIKNFYLRIQTKAPTITSINPYLTTWNTPTNIEAISIGDTLYQNNTPFARIINTTPNSFTTLTFDSSITILPNTNYYAYKQKSKPIEQSLIQLTQNINTILQSSSNPITILTTNEFTIPLALASFLDNIKIGHYIFIPPNEEGEARTNVPHVTLDDNRGLYKITNVNTNTRTLTVSPIIGTDYLTYDNPYPSNYPFVLLPSTNLAISNWFIIELNNDLEIISYLIYERLMSYIYNISSLYSSKPYVATWQDFFNENYQSNTDTDILGIYDSTTITNPQFTDITGNINTTPFSPTPQRLSILDRRYYIEDPFLILDLYLTSLPNGLKSFLEDTIDSFDLRTSRYYWLNIRTNKINGTLK